MAVDIATQDRKLELLRDLRPITTTAHQRCLPIVVLLTQDMCTYCQAIRNDIFLPMIRSGKYVDTALLRELRIDEGSQLTDLKGQVMSAKKFAQKLGSKGLTPTVMFLDSTTSALIKPIVGISNIDFYGYYLDQAINRARRQMRPECNTGNTVVNNPK